MNQEKKCISILGSTGSIGTQALEIVRNHPQLRVTAMSANHNIELFLNQILEFSPDLVCVYDETCAQQLRAFVPDVFVCAPAEHGLEIAVL